MPPGGARAAQVTERAVPLLDLQVHLFRDSERRYTMPEQSELPQLEREAGDNKNNNKRSEERRG